MARSMQDYVCATVGIAVGVFCMLQTQAATKDWMDPFIASCTEGDLSAEQRMLNESIVPYNPALGGSFVCIITQFLHALAVEHPSGLLTWGGVMVVGFPYSIIAAIEAGRVGAKGPVRYSVIIGLLAQLLGVCVILPALWIPSYIFGGSRDGPFHKDRPMTGFYSVMPVTMLAIGCFVLNPSSEAWRNCAGILGGPLLAAMPLVYYLTPTPTSVKDMMVDSEAAKASYKKAFQCMGLLSLAGWMVLVYTAWSVYGTDMEALANALWFEAHPAVKFMTIDTTGFFIANLIYAYLQSVATFGKTLLLTPFVGPGAALSYVMLQSEVSYVIPKEKQ
jgi:hypothetical protein